MEFSSSNVKKIIIFLEMKPCTFQSQPSKFFPKKNSCIFPKKTCSEKIYIPQKKAFLIIPEMEPCAFHLKLEK